MKYLLFFSLVLLLNSCHKDDYSQVDFGFTKTYGGNNNDDAKKILTINNNLYIFGSTKSYGDVNGDFYLIKADTLGNIIYEKQFGDTSNDEGFNMIKTNNNNLLLIGTTTQGTNRNIKTICTDLDGNILWETTVGGPNDEGVGGAVETSSGYFCLAATQKQNNGFKNIYLVWLNQNGDVIKEKTYGGNLNDGGMDVVNVNSDLMVLAYTNSYGAGGQDYMLLKLNSQGDSLWAKTYGGSDYEESQEFIQLSNGDFIINGHSNSTDPSHDMFAVKTDANGNQQWAENFGGVMHDGGEAILLNSKGNILLVGRTRSFGNGERNIYLVEIDVNGNVISEKPIITSTYDWATSIVELNKYYYIVGKTQPSSSGQSDVFLLKLKEF